MMDEHPHLIAECARCHFRFDILLGTDCPNCRMIAVQTTFRPRNPEDYTLEFLRSKLAEQGICWHGEEPSYVPEQEDDKKFRIPKTAEDQVYQLRRLFRLYEPR